MALRSEQKSGAATEKRKGEGRINDGRRDVKDKFSVPPQCWMVGEYLSKKDQRKCGSVKSFGECVHIRWDSTISRYTQT